MKKVAGLIGSVRGGQVPLEALYSALESENIADEIYRIGSDKKLSNSEALLLAAMWGAKREGVGVEFIQSGADMSDFSGVVISSPVYFGDRSSLVDDFIQDNNFTGKAVGAVASGAKRNGGQETTITYTLWDCLNKGAIVTGNGPPTGQYGGTGWAGNKGAIIDDDFGIKTSIGTGRQVAKACGILARPDYTNPIKVLVVVTGKTIGDTRFVNAIRTLPFSGRVELDILDVSGMDIKKCRACSICPNGNTDKVYTCMVQGDDMEKIHSHIVDSDCIILASYDDSPGGFQTFMERTRFIRRHHYELSGRVYSSYSWTGSLVGILPLRIMTSFLRQNMLALGPFYNRATYRGVFGLYENMSKELYVNSLESFTQKTKQARLESSIGAEYTPVGYEDAGREKEQAYRD